MAIISDEPYEKRGGEDSGRDSLNFTPEKHHVAAVDNPKGGDPAGAKAEAREVQEADSTEAAHARRGATWAVEGGSLLGDSLPFTPTAGLFTSGPSVGEHFHSAVQASGGVKQGPGWCSDPAPGVYRCTSDHSLSLDSIDKPDGKGSGRNAGAGRTFEQQRRSHWSHDKWGG